MELTDRKNKLVKISEGRSHFWISYIYVNIYQLLCYSFMDNEDPFNELETILHFHFLESNLKGKTEHNSSYSNHPFVFKWCVKLLRCQIFKVEKTRYLI
jgi:hypothetical protein